MLVGALALGVILASDVFHSGANVDSLLFGSLLLIGTRDLVLARPWPAPPRSPPTLVLGPRWLAGGFDAAAARALGLRSGLPDAVLLALVALGVVAALSAIGALLATALFVVPGGDRAAVDAAPARRGSSRRSRSSRSRASPGCGSRSS